MKSLPALLLTIACEEGAPISLKDHPWESEPEEECVAGFLDADGDGYAGTAAELCDGSGALTQEDCDDTDPAVHPGGAPCGLTGSIDVEDASALLLGEAEGDEAGNAVADLGDVDGDGVGDLLIGAPFHVGATGEPEAGRAYVLRGPVRGRRSLSTAEVVITSVVEGAELGWSVAGPGDADGDGYADLLLGGGWTTGGDDASARLVHGPLADGILSAAEGVALTLTQPATRLIVAGAGDQDADGGQDLLIGAPYATGPAGEAGLVLLLRGVGGDVEDLESSADALLTGEQGADQLGYDLDGNGDTDGDGTPDVLVGAPGRDGAMTEASAGGIYLLLGPLSGVIDAADADAARSCEGSGHAGWDVAMAGDVDADGYDDVLVGAPFGDPRAYLLLGPLEGSGSLADATAIFVNELEPDESSSEVDGVGNTVAGGEDLSGDGRDDYLVSGDNVAHLFYEAVEGRVEVGAADATLNVDADAPEGGAGALASELVRDADGAGTPGVLVANEHDETVAIGAGAAWLYVSE